jgi:hypothetical protein
MTRARRCRSSLAAVVGASQLIRGWFAALGGWSPGGAFGALVGPSRHPRGIVRARHVGASGRKGSGARSAPWSRVAPRVTLGGSSGRGTLAHPGGRGRGARSAPWSRVGSSRHPWGWSGRGGPAHLGWAGGRPFDRLEHGPGSDLCRNPPGRRPGEARRGGLAQGRTWHVIGAALSGSRRAHDRILRQG